MSLRSGFLIESYAVVSADRRAGDCAAGGQEAGGLAGGRGGLDYYKMLWMDALPIKNTE